MRIGKILLVALFVGLFAAPVFAQVSTPINSQGTSGAPVSVGATATAILLGNPGRTACRILSETVAIRCTLGTNAGTGVSSAGKGTPTPTASVGFYIPSGVIVPCSAIAGGLVGTSQREIDCIVATGSTATNVDTFEE